MERTKGGNIALRRVDVPDAVEPGESFEAVATVSNGAAFINPWDGDKCGLAPPGYKLNVVFEGPDGTTIEKGPDCLGTTEIGANEKEYRAVFDAPESGRAEVDAHVRMENSGKTTGVVSASANVSEDAPTSSSPPGGSSNSGLPDFDGGNGGGGPLAQVNGLMTMVVVVMLIGALIESGALGGASG